ncbi:sugar phosphate isomerase/epimerase family protein [Raoultella terrigena]|uniref:sugar phosphate isomerase/epimerase family protein n=1 Tax=Raoultella terrigena TaxID=577 RepID=UPI00349F9A22
MSTNNIELLAAYWTVAGDIYPMGPTEISPFSFEHRVEAAAKAGFKGMGFVHGGLMTDVDRLGYATMREIFETHGIKHLELEFLVDWYHTGERRRQSDKVRYELLKVAKELGVKAIKVGPGIDEEHADVELMARELKQLAREAAEHNTSIVLEIMPFSNVRTVDTAVAIIKATDEPNVGLLLDIWHLARGGVSYDEIARIPAHYIKSIELNDAPRYPVQPLWQDTIHHRVLPGDGVLDVPAFIRAVQATGYTGYWGLELLSSVQRKLPLEIMAQQAFDATFAQFK